MTINCPQSSHESRYSLEKILIKTKQIVTCCSYYNWHKAKKLRKMQRIPLQRVVNCLKFSCKLTQPSKPCICFFVCFSFRSMHFNLACTTTRVYTILAFCTHLKIKRYLYICKIFVDPIRYMKDIWLVDNSCLEQGITRVQIHSHKNNWCGQTLNWAISWHIIVMWMTKWKACDLNVKALYAIAVKVQYCKHSDLRLGGIRTHMTENISVRSTLILSPGPWKSNLLEILSFPTILWRYTKIHW